jgi:hypothetical protein
MRAATDHGRKRGLNGKDLEFGKFWLEEFRNSGDVPSGSDPCDKIVDPLGEVLQDFLSSGIPVNNGIRLVIELHRHPCIGCFAC